jgi:outer membrane protein assembly factor BamB
MIWDVDQPTHPYLGEEKYCIFRHMFMLEDRLLAGHKNERIYEIDTDTGKITNDWKNNQLPFESGAVELDGPIYTVVIIDNTIIVGIHSEDTDIGDVYGFNYDGKQLWRSNESLGNIYKKSGKLYAKLPIGARHSIKYTIDAKTGDILDEEEVPDMN